MRNRLVSVLCLCLLATPVLSQAQPVRDTVAGFPAPKAESFWEPFTEVPGDFARFISADTLKILAPAAVGALASHRLDDAGIRMAMTRLQPVSSFTPGNIGGSMFAQGGGAFAFYAFARATGSERMAAVGSDVLRAQILSQGTVQVAKMVAHRSRPDGSDNHSLPSGHTAAAFATATVLQKHFGWKAGVPAYAAGAYVAASRMSANKHHLSDVIMGAGFGIAGAHTVTIGRGTARFDVGLAPTAGGGAVTFTKK